MKTIIVCKIYAELPGTNHLWEKNLALVTEVPVVLPLGCGVEILSETKIKNIPVVLYNSFNPYTQELTTGLSKYNCFKLPPHWSATKELVEEVRSSWEATCKELEEGLWEEVNS